MKNSALPPLRERNLEVLNPLMKKGGVHDRDNHRVKRKKERRDSKTKLRQGDW